MLCETETSYCKMSYSLRSLHKTGQDKRDAKESTASKVVRKKERKKERNKEIKKERKKERKLLLIR